MGFGSGDPSGARGEMPLGGEGAFEYVERRVWPFPTLRIVEERQCEIDNTLDDFHRLAWLWSRELRQKGLREVVWVEPGQGPGGTALQPASP